ncbi:hypothetical protein M434DRAFT_399102 [Hypoxylon sp. CO27-5]|nr:hypothetical protein M434DRAFT_399102 [Hypoxylon sp. CO27-5]
MRLVYVGQRIDLTTVVSPRFRVCKFLDEHAILTDTKHLAAKLLTHICIPSASPFKEIMLQPSAKLRKRACEFLWGRRLSRSPSAEGYASPFLQDACRIGRPTDAAEVSPRRVQRTNLISIHAAPMIDGDEDLLPMYSPFAKQIRRQCTHTRTRDRLIRNNFNTICQGPRANRRLFVVRGPEGSTAVVKHPLYSRRGVIVRTT